jgi:hypothetical protein
MGMFDYIICRAELPGTPPAFVLHEGHQFQSKDLDCVMGVYEITEDGKLRQVGGFFGEGIDETVEGTFSLYFYDSSLRASYGDYSFTAAGEDWESVGYVAEFVEGEMKSLIETERERGRALPIAVMHEYQRVEPDLQIDLSEPSVGAKMFLQWGGQAEGYPVTLALKTERKWAVTTEEGDIETLHPSDFGRLLFHSREDSERTRVAFEDRRKREFEYYESLLSRGV